MDFERPTAIDTPQSTQYNSISEKLQSYAADKKSVNLLTHQLQVLHRLLCDLLSETCIKMC